MVHHVKIALYYKSKFKKNYPFKLILNATETIKYSEPRYKILISDDENKKLWEFIGSLSNQVMNNNVKFFKVPSFWDKQEYAFFALVKGSQTEIKGIFDIISKTYYPKSKIKFEY